MIERNFTRVFNLTLKEYAISVRLKELRCAENEIFCGLADIHHKGYTPHYFILKVTSTACYLYLHACLSNGKNASLEDGGPTFQACLFPLQGLGTL